MALVSPTGQRRRTQEVLENVDFQRRSHHGTTVFEPHPDDLGRDTPASQVAPVEDIAMFNPVEGSGKDEKWKAQNPFGDDAKHFEIHTPVNVAQLQDELAERGVEVHLAVASEHRDEPISEDNPGFLFVDSADVDGRTVHGAVETHEPDPLYGASAQNKAIAALRTKLADGKPLDAAELTDALSVVLGVSPAAKS